MIIEDILDAAAEQNIAFKAILLNGALFTSLALIFRTAIRHVLDAVGYKKKDRKIIEAFFAIIPSNCLTVSSLKGFGLTDSWRKGNFSLVLAIFMLINSYFMYHSAARLLSLGMHKED